MAAFEVGKNTYFTVEEADEIIEQEFMSTDEESVYWNSLTNDKDKEVLIKKATALMEKLMYIGVKDNINNKMKWPRKIDCKLIEFPYELKIAVLAQGIRMHKDLGSEANKLQTQGVKKYTTAEASIEFIGSNENKTIMKNNIYKDVYDTYIKSWVH